MECDLCYLIGPDFLCDDLEYTITILVGHNCVLESMSCPQCGKDCFFDFDTLEFYCSRKHYKPEKGKVRCRFRRSLCTDTFFESPISVVKIVRFISLWIAFPYPNYEVYEILEWWTGMSSHAVANWSMFCREVMLHFIREPGRLIGGPGMTIEIMEVNFGARKNKKGRYEVGPWVKWVFGAYCRETGDFFVVPIDEPTENTLTTLITERIAPGSKIFSKPSKAYGQLGQMGFSHQTSPASGCNTRKVEGLWQSIRYTMRSIGVAPEHFDGHLAFWAFRKKHPNISTRVHYFLEYISKVHPPH